MATIPKPNQEQEKAEIEKIILEEYGLPSKVNILSENLTSFGIPNEYNVLLIELNPRYTNDYFDINFDGKFEKFGIKYIKFISGTA
ncbi:MAG: hypothetical protein QT11_C0001G0369 [archaeon GW2011_AR20]|nr:MAG: hypothetical protein QT11_C0001G0369 [archaeon GW2011_AR20]AQS28044.1 hypothetical protein [uncultured archaeon]AQS28536.1 hypothetical protein [uncultured archaeon]AQS28646.1 hypothetical protein [uncultured archaeon]MBS3160376.1 hypothetical protein [Candidatus Woesearchaeota archaeon]